MSQPFVHSQIYNGVLINIESYGDGYRYHISFEDFYWEAKPIYSSAELALKAGLTEAEMISDWVAGFQTCCQGQPFLDSASQSWVTGWLEGLEVRASLMDKIKLRDSVAEKMKRLERGEDISSDDILTTLRELKRIGFTDLEIDALVKAVKLD